MIEILLSVGFIASVFVWVTYLILEKPGNNTNKSKTPTDT